MTIKIYTELRLLSFFILYFASYVGRNLYYFVSYASTSSKAASILLLTDKS